MAVSIIRIQTTFNFLPNQILIRYCPSQIFKRCHIFKGSVGYLYIMVQNKILLLMRILVRTSLKDKSKLVQNIQQQILTNWYYVEFSVNEKL
jgi:hypothetical protein